MCYRFLFRFMNELQEDIGVDAAATVLAGEVQMRAGTAPRVTGNGNHLTGHDRSPLPNQHLGKVAIADGIVAMAEGDELARTFVLSHLDYHTRQHGVGFFTFRVQVYPVVPPALLAERVGTETVG